MAGLGKGGMIVEYPRVGKGTREEVKLYHVPTLLSRVYGEKWRRPIRMLKIDTEGEDAQILMGMEELFAQKLVDVVIFEVNQLVSHFGVNYTQAVAMLHGHGYTTYMVGAIGKKIVHLGLFEIDAAAAMETWPLLLDTMVAFANEDGFLKGSERGAVAQPIAAAGKFVSSQRSTFRYREARDCSQAVIRLLPQCFGRLFVLKGPVGR
jgi:hypothetical protein